jgi:aminopeptidase YwaD
MMKTAKGILLILFCSIFSFTSFAQYGKNVMERLASPSFHGRGYYKNGDARAAKYIRNEFRKTGLQPVGNNYYQNFTFPVNTFPGKMKIKLGEKNLVPGKDFIVSPAAPSVKGTFPVMNVSLPLPDFKSKDYSETFLLVDKSGADSTGSAKLDSLMRNPPNVKGVIIAEPKKLTWSVSTKVNDIVFIRILKDALPAKAEQITLNIQNRFVESYATQNVIGLIPGTTNADSFIVFTAHYDHLGRMGKNALFAGANDNASGTAMIMELARHYSKPENRIGKSILFMAFAAEEASAAN